MQETERFRAYLLGRLAEDEAETLEIELLANDDLYHRLGSVEDDLVDAYATGRLNEADRTAFQSRYGGEALRDRVDIAEAFRTKAKQANVVPLRRRRNVLPLAAAAAAVLLAGTVAFLGVRRTTPAALPQQANVPVPVERPEPRAPVDQFVAHTIVLTSATRAEAPAPTIVVPQSASGVDLHVVLDPADTFDRYTLALSDAKGTTVWKSDTLVPVMRDGQRTINARVPASALSQGKHELAVAGQRTDGTSEELAFEPIAVKRVP